MSVLIHSFLNAACFNLIRSVHFHLYQLETVHKKNKNKVLDVKFSCVFKLPVLEYFLSSELELLSVQTTNVTNKKGTSALEI